MNKHDQEAIDAIGNLPSANNRPPDIPELLFDVINGVAGGVALYDYDGCLLIANQSYETFFPELAGMKPGDRFETQLRARMAINGIPDAIGQEEQWLQERMQCFNNSAITTREVLYPDGRWIQATEQGIACGILRTLFDVTIYKEISQQLLESEQWFKEFALYATDVFWETDGQNNYRYLGGRVDECLGLPATALIGKPSAFLPLEATESIHSTSHKSQERLWQNQLSFQALKLYRVLKDSSQQVLSLTGKPVFNKLGVFNGYRGTLTDVTESHNLNSKLEYQATHDDLTGFLNRRSFNRHIQNALNSCNSNDTVHTLCYLDLDQFKVVNDNCGHDAGDMLLKRLAGIIQQQVRNSDTLARLGGDEFALLLPDCSLEKSLALTNRIILAVSGFQMTWHANTCQVGVSIGLVEINQHSSTVAELLSNADLACRTAKEMGRNRPYIYSTGDKALHNRQAKIQQVQEIRNSMTQPGRMQMYFQPIVATTTPFDQPRHYELLLRLFDESGQMTPPGPFIAAAEQHDLMGEVDRWVIHHTFTHYTSQLINNPELCFSINLSGLSMSDPFMQLFVENEFSTSGCPPAQICFEVTETAAIRNLTLALQFIKAMKQLGCRFALDDFGTGLSSLSRLQQMPMDYLKIDGSLIKDVVNNETDRIMVDSICNIGRAMKIQLVAEYVEDTPTLRMLENLGVDFVQGFLIGRPEPEIISVQKTPETGHNQRARSKAAETL